MGQSEKLSQLQDLLDGGVITQDDFDWAKAELLGVQTTQPLQVKVIVIAAVVAVALVIAAVVVFSALSPSRSQGSPFSEASSSSTSSVSANTPSAADDEAGGSGDPLDIYEPVIESYRSLLETGSPSDDFSEVNEAVLERANDGAGVISYALVDLADDGEPELVVGVKYPSAGNGTGTSGSVATYRLFALYGMSDGSPVLINAARPATGEEFDCFLAPFFDSGSPHYLCEDNAFYSGSPRIDTTDESYWELPEGSTTLTLIESISGGLNLDYMDAEGAVGKVDSTFVTSLSERHGVLEDIDWQGL